MAKDGKTTINIRINAVLKDEFKAEAIRRKMYMEDAIATAMNEKLKRWRRAEKELRGEVEEDEG